MLFGVHNGQGWDQYIHEFQYSHDSLINGQNYQVIKRGAEEFFTREVDGKIYWLTGSDETLLYDFSLMVGDTLDYFYWHSTELHTVVNKERIHHASGDSLWYIEIKIHEFHPDTIYWLEGVGDLRSGLLPFIFPDAAYSHICSRNGRNQTIYASPEHPVDCNCDYLHGQDNDEDGYRNHIPMWKYFQIAESDWPPHFAKSGKHRRCDTLVIINGTGYSIDVDDGSTGVGIDPDSIAGMWEELYYYSFEGINDIIISHQQADEYYHINILECETQDCNDQDSTIHAFHIEIPYDGLDNDCNASTPDDDIDMDGYPTGIDCDDANSFVNIDQIEIVYNGHDDDCDSSTLDDDLDQDGYILAVDCEDDDAEIYPGATEIPNNGVDEDCDGNDLITSTIELDGIKITIYPNPVSESLYIKSDQLGIIIQLLDMTGHGIHRQKGISSIDVTGYAPGMYFLEVIQDSEGKRVVERIVIVK